MRDEVMATDDGDDMYDHLPSSLSTSFWSFCTDLSANSARASAYGESMCFNHCQNRSKNISRSMLLKILFLSWNLQHIYNSGWYAHTIYQVQLAEYIH